MNWPCTIRPYLTEVDKYTSASFLEASLCTNDLNSPLMVSDDASPLGLSAQMSLISA